MKKLPKQFFPSASQAGLSTAEIVLVLALLGILLGVSAPSLVNFQTKNNLEVATQTLVGDIKQQQLKAMLGEAEGSTAPAAYGVYLQANQYTLYRGSSYASGDNYFTVNITPPLVLTGVPLDLNFTQRSGELAGGNISFSITDNASGQSRQILINKLGGIDIN